MLPNQIALPHSTEALSLAPQLMLALLSLLGALSLVCGGLMAYHAREPKRVLAYSTVSQLGLCLCGYGVFAGHAAYFQLLAHAWCKAALFLGVGMLAAQWQRQGHASTEAPGLRELAGSARRAPVVQAALVLAAAALAGIPLLGSAPGKEQILWAVWSRAMTTAPGFRGTLGEAFPVLAGVWLASAVLLVIGLALTAAYLTRLVGLLAWARPLAGPEPVPAPADPADGLAPAAAEREGGWSGASLLTLALAVIGSLGTAALYFYLFEPHYHTKGTAWLWMPAGSTSLLVTAGALALTLLGAAVAWSACVAPQLRPSQPPLRRGSTLAGFFANGMYLREFWHGAVGSAGYALAVLAGRTERSVLDATVERTGRFGRALAACSAWVDRHVVDGLRWQACEFWWRIRRLHSRWLQTGDLQQYMFAILAGAVILCIVVIRPLSHIFARVLERPQ
jgi:NADH:ubiquinone oxidoreductase subunit 5 (subunit L)/multisubunit Na+/H+ antiporter MnhA subunit